MHALGHRHGLTVLAHVVVDQRLAFIALVLGKTLDELRVHHRGLVVQDPLAVVAAEILRMLGQQLVEIVLAAALPALGVGAVLPLALVAHVHHQAVGMVQRIGLPLRGFARGGDLLLRNALIDVNGHYILASIASIVPAME